VVPIYIKPRKENKTLLESIEKRIFGSGLTVILVVLYFEIRDLRIQVKNMRERIDHHILYSIPEKYDHEMREKR